MISTEASSEISQQEINRKKRTAEGGKLAADFIRKSLETGKLKGRKLVFDADFIKEIHKRVCRGSGWEGRLRSEPVGVSGEWAADWAIIPHRFYLFGRWLDAQTREAAKQPDNIVLALETAAAAHYGLTRPELHPFPEGNGRTARALVNAVLMYQADELRFYKLAIPPVPILRSYNEKEDQRYIRALGNVRRTGTLNPLMTVIAQKWAQNLDRHLGTIERDFQGPYNVSDTSLIETLRTRRDRLSDFVNSGNDINGRRGNYVVYPVPNYFDARWLHE